MSAGQPGTYVPATPYAPPPPAWANPQPAAVAHGSRPAVAVLEAALSAGSLVATWTPPNGAAVYLTRVTVSADNTCRAYLYAGQAEPRNLVSGTDSGHFDENDPNQPILIPEGSAVTVVWTTAAGSARARIEYLTLS